MNQRPHSDFLACGSNGYSQRSNDDYYYRKQGKSVDVAIEEIGQVVEGYRNTEEVHVLSKKVGVEMPICEQIYAVLYHGKSPKEAALALLGRDLKNEA